MDDCFICLATLVEPVSTVCHHYFCDCCLTDWLKEHNTCPACRRKLIDTDSDYETMSEDDEMNENEISLNTYLVRTNCHCNCNYTVCTNASDGVLIGEDEEEEISFKHLKSIFSNAENITLIKNCNDDILNCIIKDYGHFSVNKQYNLPIESLSYIGLALSFKTRPFNLVSELGTPNCLNNCARFLGNFTLTIENLTIITLCDLGDKIINGPFLRNINTVDD